MWMSAKHPKVIFHKKLTLSAGSDWTWWSRHWCSSGMGGASSGHGLWQGVASDGCAAWTCLRTCCTQKVSPTCAPSRESSSSMRRKIAFHKRHKDEVSCPSESKGASADERVAWRSCHRNRHSYSAYSNCRVSLENVFYSALSGYLAGQTFCNIQSTGTPSFHQSFDPQPPS